MLINFKTLIERFNIQPQGVLHVGANTGQEAEVYYANGVKRTIWIEADPAVFSQLETNLQKYPHARAFEAACWYVDGAPMDLNVTDNNSESSSLLPMGTHAIVHPSVKVVGQKPVFTKRLDTLLEENALDIFDYDFLNMDIQGAEIFALKGLGKLLQHIKYIYSEVNYKELYKGCALFPGFKKYLEERGFMLLAEEKAGDTGWGDAFFIRKDLFTGQLPATDFSATGGVVALPSGASLVSAPEPVKYAVDISLAKLVKKYRIPIRGIINAGAHTGADMHQYKEIGIKNIMMLEPNIENFTKLKMNYGVEADMHNLALGDCSGNMQMYLSSGDDGRSDSFLSPNIQLKQYPGIKYAGQANVPVQSLDNLNVDIGRFNALHFDVNGYELQALRGSLSFLHSCDYIYTRVYFAELFDSISQVSAIDLYLQQFGFKRVETSKEGLTWGFALYMKTTDPHFPKPGVVKSQFEDAPAADLKNEFLEAVPENEFVANVPAMFREHIKTKLPVDNTIPFEEWYYKNYSFGDNVEGMVYLPVFWNSFYINNDVENKPGYKEELQQFLNTLDKEKQYYTICMYHGGILNDVSGLKLKVFGVDYNSECVIPLVCQPHAYEFDVEKDIFISFVGDKLHPNKAELFDLLPADNKKIYISDTEHSLEDYCKILARSRYVICPMGFKEINHRAAEALQYGAIPIIYLDSQRSILTSENEIFDTDDILYASKVDLAVVLNDFEQQIGGSSVSENFIIEDVAQQAAKKAYSENFTFEALKNIIKEILTAPLPPIEEKS